MPGLSGSLCSGAGGSSVAGWRARARASAWLPSIAASSSRASTNTSSSWRLRWSRRRSSGASEDLMKPTLPANPDQVDHEHQRLVGSDHAAGPARAVCHVRRDRDPAAAADLHPGDALVPAADHLALAEAELERVAAVPARVELVAAVPGHADVVDLDDVALGGLVAVADGDVLQLELVRRRVVGDLDLWFLHVRGR